jgi:hypothetical protein
MMNIEIFPLTLESSKTLVAPSGHVIMLGWWSEYGYNLPGSSRTEITTGKIITTDAIAAYCIVPEILLIGDAHRLDRGSFGKSIMAMLDLRQSNLIQSMPTPRGIFGTGIHSFYELDGAAFTRSRIMWGQGELGLFTNQGMWFRADTIPGHLGDSRYGCRWWQAGFEQIKQTGIDAIIEYNRADNRAANIQAASNIVSFLTLNPYGVAANIASQSDNGAAQEIAKVYSYVNLASNIENAASNALDKLSNAFDASSLSINIPEVVYDIPAPLPSEIPIMDENFFDDSFFTAGGTIGDNSELFTPPITEYFEFGDSASSFNADAIPDMEMPQDASGGYEVHDYIQDDAFASTENGYNTDAQGSTLYADDTYDESIKQGSPNSSSLDNAAGVAGTVAKVGMQITGANRPAQRPTGVSPITNQRNSVTGGILSGSGSIKQTIGDFLEGSTKLGQAYTNVKNTMAKQRDIRSKAANGVPRSSAQDRSVLSTFTRPDGSTNWLLVGGLVIGGYFVVRKFK